MFKKLLLIFFVLSILPFTLSAQSTGKIVGQVADEATGEPLPGVNITIDNTLLGANTDFDGYYVILNVPVDVYTVRASFIGFQEVAMEGVRVSSRVTSDVNFVLKETPLELGEVIVITGERPLVEKNITQSYSMVTSDEIETLPVRGLNNILDLQASVVVQNGNVHIRGGRRDEVGYYLDGASVNNPVNNTNGVYVIQDAVQEVQVLAGGYTAEFGGANSGIIKTDMKTGASDWHFSIDAQTDNFVDNGKKFLGTYSYGHSIIAGTVSGPIISKNIRLFAAIENTYVGDSAKRWSEGFDLTRIDDNQSTAAVREGTPDTVHLKYLDGFTPKNSFNRWALNSTILFDFSPIQFRLGGSFSTNKAFNEDDMIWKMTNDRKAWTNFETMFLTGKFTHVINPTTFYDVKLAYFDRSTEDEDQYFGTDWKSYADSAKIHDYTNGSVVYRSKYQEPYDYLLNGIPFEPNGVHDEWYVKSDQNYYGGGIDFTSQFNKFNEVRVGVTGQFWTLRRYDVLPDTYMEEMAKPDSVRNLTEAIGARNHGYDNHGEELNSGFNKARKPVFISAYLQDKIEFKDLIINIGLRYDYFDTDDRELIDPTDPDVDSKTREISEDAWKDKDPESKISPRLGISFPVSDRTVFYAQYGQFLQMPRLSNILYNSSEYGRQIVQGGYYYQTPVGANAGSMHSTQYEVGFRQQIGEYAAIDIAGFYKNVKGQLQLNRISAAPGSSIQTYYAYGNGDFATTQGFEFKLTLRRVSRIQAQLNYTLTDAQGTGSTELTYYASAYRGTQIPTVINPLNFEQTHRGALLLDYRFGLDDGGPILERMGLNVNFKFNSGHPYTTAYFPPGGQVNAYTAGVNYMNDVRSRQALEPVNSSYTPWNFQMDLRFDKTFNIFKQLQGTFYVRVINLLNTKNVINVYDATGSTVDDGYINNPAYYSSFYNSFGGEDYLELYRAMNSKNSQSYFDETGNELYGVPRQIFVGLKLTY